jgi:P pilus assembly chaperone PapD
MTSRIGMTLVCLTAVSMPAANAQTPPPPSVGISAGAANLNITPRRVIFSRTKRTEAVYVFNQGNATATFDVTLVDRVMLPTGEILPVSDATGKGAAATTAAARVHSARDLLIVTPSRLTLEPGKGKTIRIRATLPDAAEPIEYRSHLTVTTVPPPDFGLTAEAAAASKPGELVFRVQSVFGLSIPLIVRGDTLPATAAMGPIHLDHAAISTDGTTPPKPTPVVMAEIKREGARSLYGNVEVRAGAGRSAQTIGTIRGVGIYSELDSREVRVPLTREPKPGETITVAFIDDEVKAGTELAHGSISAP